MKRKTVGILGFIGGFLMVPVLGFGIGGPVYWLVEYGPVEPVATFIEKWGPPVAGGLLIFALLILLGCLGATVAQEKWKGE